MQLREAVTEISVGAPPTAYGWLAGVDIVQVLSAVWLILLIARFIRDEVVKYRKAHKARNAPRRRSSDTGGMRATNPRMHTDPNSVRRNVE